MDALELHGAVRDTGIGIQPGQLDAVFEPFHQADGSMTRRFGGTGLGLAICAQLVRMMNGRIWVSSVPDVGSVFEFTIRIQRAPEKTRAAALSAPSAGNSSEHARPVRILVCEDNPVNRTLAERILAKSGYVTGSASNGEEAIDLFHQEEWDLVLMDVQMPGLDGVTATSRLRQECDRGKTTPIVALTAHATKADRDRCLSAGMDGYVAKPFSPEDLLTAVELHLELGRARRTALVSQIETGD